MITRQEVESAADRIGSFIHVTPIVTCHQINELTQAQVFFKAENFQKTGSFKARGATNAVQKLSAEVAGHGVATHSSGNHGQALAWAARNRNIPAWIVMPENAPRVKVAAVRSYAAEVVFCASNLKAREEKLEEILNSTGASFIPPYNFWDVIEGQSTACKEMLAQIEKPDMVLAPVGGGGLLAGTCISAGIYASGMDVIGCEPAAADDALRSFKQGSIVPMENPQTIADGLRTNLGEIPFGIISKKAADILTCSEENIKRAMRLIWERMKIVVEPSGSVPLACILEHPELFKAKRVGVILSGGNVDLSEFSF